MKIAVVATLLWCNFHANPYGPELQVKQMLCGRLRRIINILLYIGVGQFIINTYFFVKKIKVDFHTMKSVISYIKFLSKSLLIDFLTSILILLILFIINSTKIFSDKYYILPFISIVATAIFSISIIYRENNQDLYNKSINSVVLLVLSIFSFICLILTFYDIDIIPVFILAKFPLSVSITFFLPGNNKYLTRKNKKLNPQKKITKDIYYY